MSVDRSRTHSFIATRGLHHFRHGQIAARPLAQPSGRRKGALDANDVAAKMDALDAADMRRSRSAIPPVDLGDDS